MTAAEAKTFADQSVAALAAIVKTGWAPPSLARIPVQAASLTALAARVAAI